MRKGKGKRTFVSICAVVFWLLLWQLGTVFFRKSLLFAGPLQTAECLWRMAGEAQVYQAVIHTAVTISVGFGLAAVAGCILAWLSSVSEPVECILDIPVRFARSVPVAAFVVLVLLWFGSGKLSVVISAVIAFPIIYSNVFTGLKNRDHKLREMAEMYEIPFWRRLWRMDGYELFPYLESGCKTAYGMCWKAGIAAEVIAISENTIGEHLYLAKIYLETGEIFAWIVVILAASGICEGILSGIFRLVGRSYGIPQKGGRE